MFSCSSASCTSSLVTVIDLIYCQKVAVTLHYEVVDMYILVYTWYIITCGMLLGDVQ